jgi:hypothetical protein
MAIALISSSFNSPIMNKNYYHAHAAISVVALIGLNHLALAMSVNIMDIWI